MPSFLLRLAVFWVASLALPFASVAAPGDLDPSFGVGGIMRTKAGSCPACDVGLAMVLQPDGKVVVAGYSLNDANRDFAVIRLNADGALDTAFNGSGKRVIPLGSGGSMATSVAIDAVGRIVMAGRSHNGSDDDFAVVRLNANGTLDPAFGGGGLVIAPVGSANDVATGVAIDASGRIVVGGYTWNGTDNDFVVVRFNANGALDTTFAGTGRVITAFGAGEDVANALAIDPSGRIVVGGFAVVGSQTRFALARYNADGTLDAAFGGGGKVTTDFGLGYQKIHALAIDASGRIVVAGKTKDPYRNAPYSPTRVALMRYNTDGTVDSSFAGTGKSLEEASADPTPKVVINPMPESSFNSVAIDASGRILVAGRSADFGGSYTVVERYLDNGTRDSTFAPALPASSFFSVHYGARGLAVDASGRVLVVEGALNLTSMGAARFLADGALDPSFGRNGFAPVTLSQSGPDVYWQGIALQADGRIVAVGQQSYAEGDFHVARIGSDGALDATFGSGGKVTIPVGAGDDVAKSIAIDAAGRIVVAGSSHNGTNYDFAIVRLMADGTLDTTFGGTGKVTTPIGAGDDFAAAINRFGGPPFVPRGALVIDNSGRIVVAGTSFNGTNYDFAVVRYDVNGALDVSFGGTGKVTVAIGSGHDWAAALAIDSAGRLVVAGSAQAGTTEDFAVVRLNADGTLDGSFGGGTGKVTTDFGGADMAEGVAIDAQGRIALAGTTRLGDNTDVAIARYNPDGTADTGFNRSGRVVTRLRSTYDYQSPSAGVGAVAVDASGRLVLAGNNYNNFALLRYSADGTLDTTLGGTGIVTTDVGTAERFNAMLIAPDGRALAAGYVQQYPSAVLIRYLMGRVSIDLHAFVVTKSGSGGGRVTSNPPGLDCGSVCSASFPGGETVTLTAAAFAGAQFAGWSGGGCSGIGQCTVVMSAATAVTATFSSTSNSPRLANISTRGRVLTGDNVLIGGFIIGGSTPKTVVVRARGPSLTALGVPGALDNPVLNLYSRQTVIATNDDWQAASNAAAIQSNGFAPSDSREAAIYVTLDPGPYTAIVSGASGATGVGIVEVFEVDAHMTPLINIATRGMVQTGANVMIGGFIIQGSGPQTVVVRARGPSLAAAGVPNVLINPTLNLYAGQTVIASNDDWQAAANAATLQSSGFAPSDTRESAIYITLNPGAYTAIVQGVGGTTGVGIVEVFAVP